jgi:pyruvate/2-oxoglutarate dehydrogenase complex dihydrolipoamide acyltransferase (E2) component
MTEPLPITESFSAFARRLGVRPSYITKLRHDGRLVLTDDGKRVKVAESIARIEETRDENRDDVRARHAKEKKQKAGAAAAVGPPAPAASVPVPPEKKPRAERSKFSDYRTRKMLADAELAEMERDKIRGTLVQLDTVRAAGVEVGTALRAALENLPDQLAPLVAAVADEERCRQILQDHLEAILKETATRIERLGQQLAAPPAI